MILSPAKTLNLEPLDATSGNIPEASLWTSPECHPEQSREVAVAMKKRSQTELGKLLSISANLAKTSHGYWNDFEEDFDKRSDEETKPSIYAFSGAAYMGIQASECSRESILYMQNNLRIVDPLYGALRPLDRMQAYRLEMATRNVFPSDKTKLNVFWKDAVTQQLARELTERPTNQQILLNLASDEYSAALDAVGLQEAVPDVQYVKVVFREKGRVVAVHAKRARGLMVRFVAETQAQSLEDVKAFNKEGYKLVAKDSDETTLVFDRSKQPLLSAKKKAPAATEPAKTKKRTAATSTKKTEESKKRGRKAKS